MTSENWETWNHPGARPGEVFFGYASREFFERIGWKTKRLGTGPAYGPDGRIVQGYPVFVQRSEAEETYGEITIVPCALDAMIAGVPRRREKYEAVKV